MFVFLFPTLGLANSSQQLNQQLREALQDRLNHSHFQQHFSALQLSVFLPAEQKPRDFYIGSKYYNFDDPINENNLFQWGSVTKEYTTYLVVRLINQGLIHFNTTLGQIFPEQFDNNQAGSWPEAWKQVTVKELLTMTSGIPGYGDNPKIAKSINYYHHYALEDLVQ